MTNYTVDLTFGCKMPCSAEQVRATFSNWRTELCQNYMSSLLYLPIYLFFKKKPNEFNYQDYYLFQIDIL